MNDDNTREILQLMAILHFYESIVSFFVINETFEGKDRETNAKVVFTQAIEFAEKVCGKPLHSLYRAQAIVNEPDLIQKVEPVFFKANKNGENIH